MANSTRTAADAVANYKNGTANRADFWKTRAMAANWQAAAGSDAAEANYATGVQAAVSQKSRKNAIAQTPNSVYTSGIDANSSRYASGTSGAEAKMNAFFGKFLTDVQTIKSTLPPRGPRGSAQNINNRMVGFVSALAKNRGKYKVRGVAKTGSA